MATLKLNQTFSHTKCELFVTTRHGPHNNIYLVRYLDFYLLRLIALGQRESSRHISSTDKLHLSVQNVMYYNHRELFNRLNNFHFVNSIGRSKKRFLLQNSVKTDLILLSHLMLK